MYDSVVPAEGDNDEEEGKHSEKSDKVDLGLEVGAEWWIAHRTSTQDTWA